MMCGPHNHKEKGFALLLVLLAYLLPAQAQQYDKVWVIGYGHTNGDTTYRLSFTEDTMGPSIFSHAATGANMRLAGPLQHSMCDRPAGNPPPTPHGGAKAVKAMPS